MPPTDKPHMTPTPYQAIQEAARQYQYGEPQKAYDILKAAHNDTTSEAGTQATAFVMQLLRKVASE